MSKEEKTQNLISKLGKHFERKNCQKVINISNKILKIDPDNIDVLRIKLLTYNYQENYELGLKTAEKILKIDPNTTDIYGWKGIFLEKLGNKKEALLAYNKSLIYFPDDWKTDEKITHLMESLDYTEDSLNFLKELSKENPDNLEAYLVMGYISNHLAKHEDALEFFNTNIEKGEEKYENSPGSHSYLQKTETLRYLKRYDEALEIINTYIKENPSQEWYIEKAFIYKELKEHNKALSYFDKAIEIDYDYRENPLEEKGILYLELEDYDNAINCFQKIIDSEREWNVNFYMGIALKHKKEYKKSLEYLSKVKENPYNMEKYLKAQKTIEEIKNELNNNS